MGKGMKTCIENIYNALMVGGSLSVNDFSIAMTWMLYLEYKTT